MMNQIKDFFKRYITALFFYFEHHEDCHKFCLTCQYFNICREDRRGQQLKDGDKLCQENL